MSLVQFKARNHGQQVRKRGANPDVDDRATTPEVFDPLNERFGFTVDVAASAHNTKLPRYYTIEDDGLTQNWDGEVVWCNPPFSNIRPWVEKAITSDATVVMVVPANRTEQAWWQDLIEPRRDRPGSPLKVEFLRGRLRFIARDGNGIKPNERPPFGCCLLIWGEK